MSPNNLSDIDADLVDEANRSFAKVQSAQGEQNNAQFEMASNQSFIPNTEMNGSITRDMQSINLSRQVHSVGPQRAELLQIQQNASNPGSEMSKYADVIENQ